MLSNLPLSEERRKQEIQGSENYRSDLIICKFGVLFGVLNNYEYYYYGSMTSKKLSAKLTIDEETACYQLSFNEEKKKITKNMTSES